MTIISSTFDRAGELYSNLFADWLHIHFLIRTVLILFVLWLFVYLATQVIKYVIAPAFLLFFYHVIFRAWNFLFIETPYEWLCIRYHAKGREDYPASYLRLCDRVKRNRMILSHTKYKGVMIRSRSFAQQFLVVCAVTVTLWASAFGLHREYAIPAMAFIPYDSEINIGETAHLYDENNQHYETTQLPDTPDTTPQPATTDWQENIVFALNEQGRTGARLRDGPGIADQTIIEILWDDATLTFLNEYVPDTYVNGLYWLLVQTDDGTIGYISSQLLY
ncbi:MAG: SH3 domain-containing protein [Defluviitaleaceae bacterium]|nr:SH3 domain-containing protein [Defluviitaleaceae bacterium]